MFNFKATVLSLLSFSSVAYHAQAAQMEFDRRSPEPSTYSAHQQRLVSSPMKAKKTLTISHPIQAEGMYLLKDSSLSEIHLKGVYVGHQLESGYFVKDYSIPVTIEIINPAVEVLSLESCGLTDELVSGITRFKSLKALYLDGNFLTDQTAILLASMERLKVISLALNEDISINALRTLLAMPNLEELDLSFNKKIDSEGGKLILTNDNKIKVIVKQTSIPTRMQLEIKKRQEAF